MPTTDDDEKVADAPTLRCCLFDGGEFEGKGYSPPNCKKTDGAFGFDTVHFCGPCCAKGYLDTYCNNSPHLLTWLHLHVRRDLGIKGPIPTAPSPRIMAKYQKNGKGLTLEEFRQFEDSHKLAERIENLPLDQRVWEQGNQQNSELPFFEVVRNNRVLADRLFREFQAAGKPIPKTLLNDAAVAAAAAAADAALKPATKVATTFFAQQQPQPRLQPITREDEETKHDDVDESGDVDETNTACIESVVDTKTNSDQETEVQESELSEHSQGETSDEIENGTSSKKPVRHGKSAKRKHFPIQQKQHVTEKLRPRLAHKKQKSSVHHSKNCVDI